MSPLPRTVAAIAAYDQFDESTKWSELEADEWFKAYHQLEELGRVVGLTFGEETKDHNDPQTCEALVRPGPKVPGPGFQISFVRRMCSLSLLN